MMGLRIFLHSIRLVLGQFGAALRISAVPFIVSNGLFFAASATLFARPELQPWETAIDAILLIFAYLMGLWAAVTWHRFVLLDELPASAVPQLSNDRLWPYLGRVIQVVAFGILLSIPLGIAFALVTVPFGASRDVITLLLLVLALVGIVFLYRFAPMLPATAIGRPLGLRASWNATKGAWGTLLILAVLSSAVFLLLELIAGSVARIPGAGDAVSLGLSYAVWWFQGLVYVSIMTTIYGVYVEGRSLEPKAHVPA